MSEKNMEINMFYEEKIYNKIDDILESDIYKKYINNNNISKEIDDIKTTKDDGEVLQKHYSFDISDDDELNDIKQYIGYPTGIVDDNEYAVKKNCIVFFKNKRKFYEKLKKIGNFAFYGNNIENSLDLPDSVDEMGEYAFAYNRFKHVKIPNELKEIKKLCFYKNNILELNITKNLEKIHAFAFAYNNISHLNYLQKFNKLTEIGKGAFAHNKIRKLYLNNNIVHIGSAAFMKNNISQIVISEGLKYISPYCFSNNNLTTVRIPSNVKIIGQKAFSDNQFLNHISMPHGLLAIDSYAFAHTNLKRLIIPKTVEYLNEDSLAYSGSKEIVLTKKQFDMLNIKTKKNDIVYYGELPEYEDYKIIYRDIDTNEIIYKN